MLRQLLRYVYAVDLSGNLSNLKDKYKNSIWDFDGNNVLCGVTEWKSRRHGYTAGASCLTNDHELKGFCSGKFANIYTSKKFESRVEAEAHLEVEIRRSSKNHPTTNFYREKKLHDKNGEYSCWEFCRNGHWQDCNYPFN